MYRRRSLGVIVVLVATLVTGACTGAPETVADAKPIGSLSPTPTGTCSARTASEAASTCSASPTPSSAPDSAPSSTPSLPPLTTVEPGPADKELALLANGLYRAGKIPAVPCSTPKSAMSSKAGMLRFARVVVDCLDRAWRPVVERSGNLFAVPNEVVDFSTGQASVCGTLGEGVYGFYCRANSTIYARVSAYLTDDADSPYAEAAVIRLLAHEYGHHVQDLVGISAFYAGRYWRVEGAARLQESRRYELQGECLAAAFLGANEKPLRLTGVRYRVIEQAMSAGDEPGHRTHGSPASNKAWTAAAYRTAGPAACNTWAAPAAKVS